MNKRRTSLKDLAARLGVSIATVSRALRNSHEVGDEMKEKVQALAKEMNYRPNPFAQSLRKEAPRIIGVVVPNLVTHYYAAVLDGVEDFAVKNGYSVISANSHENHEREARAIDNFINLHVEGIIACLAQDTVDYSHFKEIHDMGIPLVFFARTCLPELFSSVVGNGDVAAQEATQHLIETGSRRIAFIGGPNHLDMVRRRKHGYLEALRENRIEIDRTLVVCDKIDYDVAREQTMGLLRREDRPDAILAFNDIITYAAFDAIKASGLSSGGCGHHRFYGWRHFRPRDSEAFGHHGPGACSGHEGLRTAAEAYCGREENLEGGGAHDSEDQGIERKTLVS